MRSFGVFFVYVCDFLIPKNSLKNPARNLGLFTTTIFICTSLSLYRPCPRKTLFSTAEIISIPFNDTFDLPFKRAEPEALYRRYSHLSSHIPTAISASARITIVNLAERKQRQIKAAAKAITASFALPPQHLLRRIVFPPFRFWLRARYGRSDFSAFTVFYSGRGILVTKAARKSRISRKSLFSAPISN